MAELVTWGLLDSTWAIINILTAMGFMLYINWQMALIVFVVAADPAVCCHPVPQAHPDEYREVRKINSKITGAYNENITGVRVVKALGREEENLSEFGELTGEMYRASTARPG